jgi:serine/threonine-protein kinase
VVILVLALAAIAATWYFTQSDTKAVPAVEGLALDDAVTRVQDEGFKADIVSEPNDAAEGTVFRQSPGAGTDADEGSEVQLLVSKGPADVAIPNAVGVTETEARDRLAAAGLQASTVKVFATEPAGQVIAQSPAAGSSAPKGSSVRLNVSKGPSTVTVPSVVGSLAADAETRIEAAGLKPNAVRVPAAEAPGTVVAQNPTGGQAQAGSTVRLNISTGP